MNITFQTMKTSYRSPVPAQRTYTPQTEKVKGDYDTINISRSRVNQDSDESFAQILARRAASQLKSGASPERVSELQRQVAEGTYVPDSQKIAGRLLGLS
ncbi:MAG: flagellar biosynthesis anti-sigma factor FlgM [Hungatella sp.]|nr:flagellar biosynthesis anti-sigma factor FlgM [Hungatella sp.]